MYDRLEVLLILEDFMDKVNLEIRKYLTDLCVSSSTEAAEFFWPRMSADIAKLIKCCHTC